MIKITSGKLRGRTLKLPENLCHPMGSRERLALFNYLGDIQNLKVLDLFAGSGALGVEALSRGAASVTFVETNPKIITHLKQNLLVLDLTADTKIIKQKVQSFQTEEKFDLIFADPPYDNLQLDFLQNIPALISPNGIFVLSNPTGSSPKIPQLKLISSKVYAGCQLSFYQAI